MESGANTEPTATVWRDVGIILGAMIVALVLGAATLRRRAA